MPRSYNLQYRGGDCVILCAKVRRRAPQVVRGIDTDRSSICIFNAGEKESATLREGWSVFYAYKN
jgi:hypothetical protein